MRSEFSKRMNFVDILRRIKPVANDRQPAVRQPLCASDQAENHYWATSSSPPFPEDGEDKTNFYCTVRGCGGCAILCVRYKTDEEDNTTIEGKPTITYSNCIRPQSTH